MTTHLHAPTPIRARARVDRTPRNTRRGVHLPTLSHQKVFHGIKGGKVSPGPAVYRGMTLLQAIQTRNTVSVDISLDLRSGLRITYRRSGKVSVRIGEVLGNSYGYEYLGEAPRYHLDLVPTARYQAAVNEWRSFAEQMWAEHLATS